MTDLNQVEQTADKAVEILSAINPEAGKQAAEVKEGIEAEVNEIKDAVLDFKSEEAKNNFAKEAMDVIKTAAAGDLANLPKEALEVVQTLSEHNNPDLASAIKEGGDVVKDVKDIAGVFADGKVTQDELPILINAGKELAHDIPEAIAAGGKLAGEVITEIKEEVEEIAHSSWFQSIKSFFTFGWVSSGWNWFTGLFNKAPAAIETPVATEPAATPEKADVATAAPQEDNSDALHTTAVTTTASENA